MISNLSLPEAYEEVQKLVKENYVVIRYNRIYDLDELASLQEDLEGGTKTLQGFKIVIKEILSMRKALIVILQEKCYEYKSYDEVDINIQKLHNYANSRFIIGNRDKTHFDSPQKIHPKNPCFYYENKPYEKRSYRMALKELTIPSKIFFIDEKALENLISIYEEILICKT